MKQHLDYLRDGGCNGVSNILSHLVYSVRCHVVMEMVGNGNQTARGEH